MPEIVSVVKKTPPRIIFHYIQGRNRSACGISLPRMTAVGRGRSWTKRKRWVTCRRCLRCLVKGVD